MQIVALAMGLFAEGGGFPIRPEILLLILFAFYFIVMRPVREEKRQLKSLLDGLKKNDRVVTASGIKATVASVNREKNEAVLTIDKSTKAQMTVTLESIGHVVVDEKKKADETKKAETE